MFDFIALRIKFVELNEIHEHFAFHLTATRN